MIEIAYHYPVRPRHREAFEHAYRAARITLLQTAGLQFHRLDPSEQPDAVFVLQLNWIQADAFERFTRTWFGVWVINGLGLPSDAFNGAIETREGPPVTRQYAARRAA